MSWLLGGASISRNAILEIHGLGNGKQKRQPCSSREILLAMLLTDLQGSIWQTGDQCENTVRLLRLEGYLDYSTRTSELQKEKEVVRL